MNTTAQKNNGKNGVNGKQAILQKVQKVKMPKELEKYVIIDQVNKIAYCVKEVDKSITKVFRNHVSMLKQLEVISGYKFASAEKFSVLKSKILKSNEQLNSDMQQMIVNIFKDAAKKSATDVHIVDYGTHGEVLFRINKELRSFTSLPEKVPAQLFNAVYTSMTDIAEPTYKPKQPQKARIKDKKFLPDNVHSIRVGSSPEVDGAFMVFRLLKKTKPIPFEEIGYSKDLGQQNLIRLMQKRPKGIIVIAGPTGSGKSTSLFHLLMGMKKENPHDNFITVEDPPEYPMSGIRQIPVMVDANATNEDRCHAYNKVLDSLLRLDPDILMAGEIRDKATAELAVQQAMTGHKVWATIHANNPFNIITRLVRRLESQNALQEIADVNIINGLVYQELVQTLCPHCKLNLNENLNQVGTGLLTRISNHIPIGKKVSIKGPGCEKCDHTGVSGMTLLAEVVCPDHQIMEHILKDGIGSARRYWLEKDGKSIIHHAIEKVSMGVLDPVMAEKVVGPLTLDKAFEDKILKRDEVDVLVQS